MLQEFDDAVAACETFMSDKDDALALPREAAEFLHAVVRAAKVKKALEIGTSYGYSGLWIGAALSSSGGRLITIDKETRKSAAAAAFFADAGLADTIECKTGVAEEIIAHLDGPFDFVLNDADKQNCQKYVELLLPKLTPGAVVLTDNTVSHAAELADFVSWMRSHDEFFSVHVPLGSGMEMSVRK